MQLVDLPAALVRRVVADIELKDAPVAAGAIHAEAKFLATYDRKHLLAESTLIQERFGIVVETPDAVLATVQ